MRNTTRIPLAVKLAYTAFVAVMVPVYWHDYGLQNFLYFCDVAVLLTLVGIWTESALLISMQAVGIVLPQLLWIADFASHILGIHLLGMTDYMFDPTLPLFLRGLSLFHGWLPILLLWLVWRLGYDRRAIFIQPMVGVGLLLVCYFCFVPPGTLGSHRMAVNINYVFGMSETGAQTRMPPLGWLGVLVVGIPSLLYAPAHLILSRLPRRQVMFVQQAPQESPASQLL
jgi:hypothetical protein